MQYVHSMHPVSRQDLYIKTIISNETELKKHSVVIEEHKYVQDQNGHKVKTTNKFLYTSIFDCNKENVKKQETRRNQLVALQDNENNLLDVINPHRNQNLDMDINDQDEDGVNEAENEQQRTLSLDEYLKSDSGVILTNILNELKNSNLGKWSDKSIEDLFPTVLTNGTSLLEETTVKELNIMCLELCCATGRNWSSSNMVKVEIVNEIVKAFGGNNFVNIECRKKKLFNPESLVTLCVNSMKNNLFPKELIQIPLASLWQIEHRHEWFGRATVPLKCYVPTSMQGKIKTIDFFSYPEFCHTRN